MKFSNLISMESTISRFGNLEFSTLTYRKRDTTASLIPTLI